MGKNDKRKKLGLQKIRLVVTTTGTGSGSRPQVSNDCPKWSIDVSCGTESGSCKTQGRICPYSDSIHFIG